jgi:hypothetical protein
VEQGGGEHRSNAFAESKPLPFSGPIGRRLSQLYPSVAACAAICRISLGCNGGSLHSCKVLQMFVGGSAGSIGVGPGIIRRRGPEPTYQPCRPRRRLASSRQHGEITTNKSPPCCVLDGRCRQASGHNSTARAVNFKLASRRGKIDRDRIPGKSAKPRKLPASARNSVVQPADPTDSEKW